MDSNRKANNPWITLVLITAVIMLIFLVFYGNKAPTPTTTTPPIENGSLQNGSADSPPES